MTILKDINDSKIQRDSPYLISIGSYNDEEVLRIGHQLKSSNY